MSRGAPLPGARAVEGSQASEGGKDAGAGAHPPGRSCGPGAQRGSGARPGPLVDGGIPWPRQSDHKGGCGRGARGSRRGADGSGDSAARGGPGRGRPGRAVAALRLLKSKQLSVLRAASGRPAPLPVSPLTFGRLQFRERHVFKFLWVRNLPELQSATKGRRSRRLAAGAEPGRLPRGARAPSPPRAHRLVLSLSRPSPGSDGGGRGRLRRSVCRGPEMGGGECVSSAPFRTSLRASRSEGDPGHSALQPPPGRSRARGSRPVCVCSVGEDFSSSSVV